MTNLSAVRHAVRRAAARTRRAVLWTPQRYRAAVAAVVAVLVLVPVVSLVARSPWTAVASGAVGAAAGAAPDGLANGLGGAVDIGSAEAAGEAPAAPEGAGPTPAPSSGVPTARDEPAVDPRALPVDAVLADGPGASPTGSPAPARDPGAATDEPTPAPDAVTDRWKDQARESAVRFAQAWLAGATASSSQEWLASLEPWLDPEAERLVALTNLAAIPRARATSVRLLTLTEAEATAVVALEPGGRLDVALTWDGERWRVTSYEPVAAAGVDAPASPATTGPGSAPPAAKSTPAAP